MISWDVFACIIISLVLMLVPVPLIFIMLWRKKGLPVNSFFSGAAVFVVFYLVIRFYLTNSLGGSSLLSLFLSALVVEGGRFIGLAILPGGEKRNNYSLKTGLSLALGYITAAFLLINAFEMAMNLVYAGALQGWGILADFLDRFPRESVDRVQLMITSTPSYTYLLELLSLFLAVPVQILLTLMVFQFYRSGGSGPARTAWIGGAVILNFFYFQVGSFAAEPGWLTHIVFLLLMGVLSFWTVMRVWKGEFIDTFGAP